MAIFSGCEKIVFRNPSDPVTPTDTTPPTITLSDPANNTTGVALSHPIAITFSEVMDSTTFTSSTVTLMQGTTLVAGIVKYKSGQAIFTQTSSLSPNKVYTGTVTSGVKDAAGNALSANYTFSFTTGAAPDVTPPVVSSTSPVTNSTGASLSQVIVVTFNEAMDPLTITASTFTLKQGTTAITGTISYTGTQATFVPSVSLSPSVIYTATITTGAKDVAGNALTSNYTFSFTTSGTVDTTPPTVTSTDPANSATGVALTKAVAVNFSEGMNATTITSTNFTLKLGTTSVAGAVTYSGTKATFTPSASLTPNSVYAGTITTGAKDLAGNAISATYTFSFTTGAAADVTPPTVASTTPANNATGVATSQVVGITFSEAMMTSSITSSTFTLKQGTTAVSGTVSCMGSTATFTPSAALITGTVYTASITTGAKDMAGNALTAGTTWSFTTTGTAPAPQLSFATDVIPVLNMCENCHSHGWSPSSTATTYYNNLVSRSYVKAASYTSSTIYTKIQSGHPGTGSISKANTDKIINWMIQGSKNN
jgi:methionine-rich copper-binding protein CopC